MSKILIISEDESRKINMETILSFVGENYESLDIQQAESVLKSSADIKAVIIDTVDAEATSKVVSAYPHHPFITISTEVVDLSEYGNLVGQIHPPVTYPVLTQYFHRCQEYLRQKPTNKQSVNTKTRLFRSLVGKSMEIQQVRQMIEKVSPTEANVLVLGESGTGKEVVARNIHFMSKRKDGPFIPVNCGAIPGELLESELFGHEKGAFTGAISARKGRFELAQGGTLFLDEIGDMPLQMQVKLLRVLQERLFERVGGSSSIHCDVRIVAATHRNLESMIEEGKFREDLFYRLNVFPIDSPALRERKEDIPLLLQELVSRMDNEVGGVSVKFTENALKSLMEHKWAGNVRELSNLVERLIILYPNQVVDVQDLPDKYQHLDGDLYEPDYPEELLEREALNALFRDDTDEPEEDDLSDSLGFNGALPPEGVNLKEYLSDLEVSLITQALEQQDWVVARAAEQIGMRRTTLVEKMRKYHISKE
jgi:sigma-54 specific flagellar transcriptional regulator A